MIKTLWYSLYFLLALAIVPCAVTALGSVVAAVLVSPWFIIGLPIGIFLGVTVARAAGWAVDRGLNA